MLSNKYKILNWLNEYRTVDEISELTELPPYIIRHRLGRISGLDIITIDDVKYYKLLHYIEYAKCNECNKVFNILNMTDGICNICLNKVVDNVILSTTLFKLKEIIKEQNKLIHKLELENYLLKNNKI